MAAFQKGERITLEYAAEDGDLHVVLTKIAALDAAGLALVDPDEGGAPLPFQPGASVMARVDDVTHLLASRVSFRERTPDGLLLFDPPQDVERYPKRRYFRMAVDLPLEFGRTDGRAVDLSGSGLLALCPKDRTFVLGTLEEGVLVLPKARIRAFMKVVRLRPADRWHTLVGLDFQDLPEADRDRVIGYILDRQRHRMKVIRLR